MVGTLIVDFGWVCVVVCHGTSVVAAPIALELVDCLRR